MKASLITQAVIAFLKDYKHPRTWHMSFTDYKKRRVDTDICSILVHPRRIKHIKHKILIIEYKPSNNQNESYVIQSELIYTDKLGRTKAAHRVRSIRTASHHTLLDDMNNILNVIRHDIMVLNQYRNSKTIQSKKVIDRIRKGKHTR